MRFMIRNRIWLGYLGLIGIVIGARPTLRSLLVGAPCLLLGGVVRVWAAGHLVRNMRLARRGPYAYTRNPLYLGTALEWLGLGIAGRRHLPLIAAAVWFLLLYVPSIREEERFLSDTFGHQYDIYAAQTPRFLPRRPKTPVQRAGFVLDLVSANHEHFNLTAAAALYLALWIRAYVSQGGGSV